MKHDRLRLDRERRLLACLTVGLLGFMAGMAMAADEPPLVLKKIGNFSHALQNCTALCADSRECTSVARVIPSGRSRLTSSNSFNVER